MTIFELYFSDFLMESGVSQCDWCGGLEGISFFTPNISCYMGE